ncbi:MAG TPA: signal recognition particle protein [Candidatus Ruthenibacterium merdigallinarum]|nr:signal recognition particle protein [Candidatus Ruthenibacterium merdigallinarum]
MAFESLSGKLAAVFKKLRGKGKLSEQDIRAAMREVRMALLEADVNYKVAKDFIAGVTERALGQEVMESLTPAQQVIKIVNDELTALMGGDEAAHIRIKSKPPTVIMLCGLQGAGKTTHAAKLGKLFLKEGHRPLLVACDIYRPAAIDQLCVVGKQAGVPVFRLDGAKPEQIAHEAWRHARDHGNDIVILDTAGRLHIDEALMDELQRIKQAVEVDDTLLVIDAMAGQDAVNVAKAFGESTGLDGVILTKLDGDTRGGSALSVRAVTGKPILYAGVGEKLDDLEVFHPARMAGRILGMGDVLTLIEKAQAASDEKKAEETARKLMENKFDMNDMLDQLHQMKKMGGVGALLSMLPGLSGKVDADKLSESKEFVHIEAIILSMTPAEREKPSIINPKRKRRIAAGSGTRVEDVNRLLRQFEQMSKMMRQLKKNPKMLRGLGKLGFGGAGMPGMPGF